MTMTDTKEDKTTPSSTEDHNRQDEENQTHRAEAKKSESLETRQDDCVDENRHGSNETTGQSRPQEHDTFKDNEGDKPAGEVTLTSSTEEDFTKNQYQKISDAVEVINSVDQTTATFQKTKSGNISPVNCIGKEDTKQTMVVKNELQGVLDNIKTNDSPIQAVNELTDMNMVKGYTVQWRPYPSLYCTRAETKPSDLTSATVGSPVSDNAMVHSSPTDAPAPELKAQDPAQSDISQQEPCESQSTSVLELTVGKLKVSQSNGTIVTTSDGELQPGPSSKVPLASSAPPDYLQDLLYRSQLNRRKMRVDEHNAFVPKLSPPPIFRGHGGRRGRPIRRTNMPVVAQFSPNCFQVRHFNPDSVPNGGLDLSPNVTIASCSKDNDTSNDESFVINRTPLRNILPKPNAVPLGQPLTVETGPTTPPSGITRPVQHNEHLQLRTPIVKPKLSPSSPPTQKGHGSGAESPVAGTSSPNLQDQPLDLCTKSNDSSCSEDSSAPSSPAEVYDENEPLNLSKEKSEPSPKTHRQPLKLPPMTDGLAGIWKTPPRSMFAGYHQAEGTSSPLEGDTASDKAANSPGLDNQKMPYGVIMSPNMGFMNGLFPMGSMPQANHMGTEGFPEGAILLPGPGPHYRLSPRMALQHNEPPTPERPYRCDECGATFKRNKSLKQHHRVHTTDKPFKCDDCDKNFQYSTMLKQHEKSHAGVKPHSCDICPRRFAHPEQLKRHTRIHKGEKPFICESEHCGKRFTDGSQLKLHMRTHSSHKPFPCPYCPLRFKYSGDVKRHVRIHTGEKPYVCGYCKMRFTQSNTLKQHERTHTGERPYHCHKCGMTFTQSGSLKYHLAHRHPPDVQTFIISSNASTLTSASHSMGIRVMNMPVDS